ncbi:MAG TPA: MFS transporter [Vicinamibacterales bacterium]|nr:MFS transporter [Vicinamibacterales bacterium]
MTPAPSRARHVVTAFAVVLALITYIDRVAISVSAPFISKDLGLTTIQMGWALAAFAWAYALFEIPGGWLGDRIGPRKVLMRIVIWWSLFTAATGWAWNATSLILIRALFGAGEAGAFPNMTRVFTTWLPTRERERAQAILWLATRVSGAFTPILVAGLISLMDWRRTFEIFGVVGAVWAIFFYRYYRDQPAEHPDVNAAELAMLPPARDTAIAHGGVPWGVIFSSPHVWLLSIQYMCLAYGWWFYINWLPTYLLRARGTTLTLGALLSGLPLLLGGAGCLVSAALIPRIARKFGSVALARRVIAITGFVGASACIVIFTGIENPTRAMIVLGFAGFFNDFVMPAAWAGTMDIGGRYSGTVSGAMNMMGSIAGASSVLVVGYLLAWTSGNWTVTFYISSAIYLVGAVCWLFLDSHTPVEQPAVAARTAA